MRRITGMTLTELMITVAIVGIISAVAIPSYLTHMQSSRRSDAQVSLLQLQLQQENYRLENSSYGSTSDITMPTSDYYTFTVSGASATAYTLTATAKSSQTSDTGCTTLTLDQSMTKSPSSCWE